MTRVLFMGPLPEPVTGHSLACQVFLDALRPAYAVDVVDLGKKSFVSGLDSIGRVFEIAVMLARVLRNRARADIAYLTISESLAGNLKDIAIYCILGRKLSHTIIHLHGGSIKKDVFDRYALLRWLNRRFLRKVGRVVILGECHRHIFHGMVDNARISVVKNFAQDFLFADDAAVSAKFSDGGPLRILFLSNLISGKGYDDLVAAYQALSAEGRTAVQLHFAGDFEDDFARKGFLNTISSHPGIVYHGVVRGEAKNALLDKCHIFCLPTKLSEGQPISILEAYAAGCAVITTSCGGIPDIFTPGVNGYGIEKAAPASITAAIENAMADPAALLQFARHNREAAEQLYRVEIYNRSLLNIVGSISPQAA